MKILPYPHPALRYKSVPIITIDEEVRKQAAQMLELMYESKGLGLASNQVGLPYRLFVMNPEADPEKPELERVCINPVILERKGSVEGEEGCLSFPKLFQKVRRPKTVKVHYYNLAGELCEVVESDLTARVMHHEIDHLDGVLFIDKMGPFARLAARGDIKEFERQFRRAQEKGDYPADAAIEGQLKELAARASLV
jgi:peptide deformylase